MGKVSYSMPYLPLMIKLFNFGINIAQLFFSKNYANDTRYTSTKKTRRRLKSHSDLFRVRQPMISSFNRLEQRQLNGEKKSITKQL